MEPEDLLSALIRQHLFVTLYRGMAGSLASEHAMRLLAMQTAERNIEEHLTEMMTAYHHKRQEAITEELLDITSGFEVSGSHPDVPVALPLSPGNLSNKSAPAPKPGCCSNSSP